MQNGQFVVLQENEYSYILSPRRKGVLTVPAVSVAVGSKRFRTQEAKIQVDDVPIGAQTWDQDQNPDPAPMPKPQTPTIPDSSSPWGPNFPGLSQDQDPFQQQTPKKDTYNFPIPGDGRQTFFVKAIVKKTTAFVGEMIEVSYRAYTKSMNIREAEITKFPEFKGFLKEELYLPKTFNPQPVIIQGQSFFETELLRYALYPLKEGSITIDSMNFRSRISNLDSLADSILRGTPFDGSAGSAIPMEKSSAPVTILVKPLPLPKPDSFTGAVGQFRLEGIAPQKTAQAEQPFSMIINIEGLGNLKSIEPPKLLVPKEIDITNIATHPSALHDDGSGSIQFEYLLTPNQAGAVQIAESEWSFFDPSKVEYVRLKIPSANITITPASKNSKSSNQNEDNKPAVKLEWSWSPLAMLSTKTHRVSDFSEPSIIGSHTIFGIHLLTLLFALAMLWKRRKSDERRIYLETYPWTYLEEAFLKNQKFSALKLAENLDLWTRLRLVGHFKTAQIEHNLHSESPRSDFIDVLKQNLPTDFHKTIDSLKLYWAELDSMRFSGNSGANSEMPSKVAFEKARSTIRQIEKSLRKSEKKLYQGFKDEWSN